MGAQELVTTLRMRMADNEVSMLSDRLGQHTFACVRMLMGVKYATGELCPTGVCPGGREGVPVQRNPREPGRAPEPHHQGDARGGERGAARPSDVSFDIASIGFCSA